MESKEKVQSDLPLKPGSWPWEFFESPELQNAQICFRKPLEWQAVWDLISQVGHDDKSQLLYQYNHG